LGSIHEYDVGCRIIAATHQDLALAAEDGSFRSDLFQRLNVLRIDIPPLRERSDDIPLIADHMIRRAASSLATTAPVLSDDALTKLTRHSWPGNVRELEHCVMRAVVLAAGSVIRGEHLSIATPRQSETSKIKPLDVIERDHVARALAATRGRKVDAAALLGVSRPRLNRLIEKYELD